MRILVVANSFPPMSHGAAVCMEEIVKRLSRFEEVAVLIPYTRSFTVYQNTEVILAPAVPTLMSHNLAHLVNLSRYSRTYHDSIPDVILAQHSPHHLATFTATMISRKLHRPLVVRAEDLMLKNPRDGDPSASGTLSAGYSWFMNEITLKYRHFFSRLLVMCSEIKAFVEKQGLASDQVEISPNGADVQLFRPYPSDSIRNRLGAEHTVLFAGSMQTEDALTRIVRVAPRVLRECPSTFFLLVGSGPEEGRVRELSRRYGVERNVQFLGKVPHSSMPGLINNSDICLGPLRMSRENAFTIPLKIPEYMACAKPVISSPVSTDILRHGKTGLVVGENQDSLASQMISLLNDEKEQLRLGQAARKLVLKRFSWNSIVENLRATLSLIVDSP